MNVLLQPVKRLFNQSNWICNSCAKRYASTKKNPSRGTLPTTPARTRFAPSPTGSLHLGSLRTALFNYLLAKATGGQFLLRIEDTDQRRTIAGAEEKLCQDLRWAGLEWDEGPSVGGPYGPYKQSERTAIYRQHAEQLLESGHAYRCFCSPERLLALAKQRADLGLPTDYDRACTHVPTEEAEDRARKGEAHVIRLKVPKVYPDYKDIVYGTVRHRVEHRPLALNNPAYEDPILLKSDGFPTYHLANVVDDRLMKITHVVRGAEWMSSTPKHLAMYQAFGWEPPAFAHVGLLTDTNGQKLSKRNMDVDVASYRDKLGILPEALVNFVALLGWSHGQKKDFMSLSDLVKNFSMKFTTGDTVVTFEKMWYLQKLHAGSYIDLASTGDRSKISCLATSIVSVLKKTHYKDTTLSDEEISSYVEKLLELGARGYTNAEEFVANHKFFFKAPVKDDLAPIISGSDISNGAPRKPYHDPKIALWFASSFEKMSCIAAESWTAEVTSKFVEEVVQAAVASEISVELEDGSVVPLSKKQCSTAVHDYIRWALTADMPGPPTVGAFLVLGREESIARLKTAKAVIKTHVVENRIENMFAMFMFALFGFV